MVDIKANGGWHFLIDIDSRKILRRMTFLDEIRTSQKFDNAMRRKRGSKICYAQIGSYLLSQHADVRGL